MHYHFNTLLLSILAIRLGYPIAWYGIHMAYSQCMLFHHVFDPWSYHGITLLSTSYYFSYWMVSSYTLHFDPIMVFALAYSIFLLHGCYSRGTNSCASARITETIVALWFLICIIFLCASFGDACMDDSRAQATSSCPKSLDGGCSSVSFASLLVLW